MPLSNLMLLKIIYFSKPTTQRADGIFHLGAIAD